MSGAEITITVDDAGTAAILGQLAALMDDMTPVMDEIGGHLVASTQMRFEDSKGPGGVAWKPSLRALKAKGQTLVESGRLKASITHEAGPKSVTVGTNVAYAAIHQFGGEIQQYAYSRKVRFRSFEETGEDGVIRKRHHFANAKAKKDVTEKAVEFGARAITMPARPFLGFDEDDRTAVVDIIAGHINRITGGGGAATL